MSTTEMTAAEVMAMLPDSEVSSMTLMRRIIDRTLESIAGRDIVSASEMTDVLLDLRSAWAGAKAASDRMLEMWKMANPVRRQWRALDKRTMFLPGEAADHRATYVGDGRWMLEIDEGIEEWATVGEVDRYALRTMVEEAA